MSTRISGGFTFVIATIVAVSGTGLALQWREATQLRAEVERVRASMTELESLRADNRRLHSQQIPATELEQLRADHVAVQRLKAELNAVGARGAPAQP